MGKVTHSVHFSFVGRFVEFIEEEKEHNGMHSNPPHEGFWIVAIDEEKLGCVNHDGDELNLIGSLKISSFHLMSIQYNLGA